MWICSAFESVPVKNHAIFRTAEMLFWKVRFVYVSNRNDCSKVLKRVLPTENEKLFNDDTPFTSRSCETGVCAAQKCNNSAFAGFAIRFKSQKRTPEEYTVEFVDGNAHAKLKLIFFSRPSSKIDECANALCCNTSVSASHLTGPLASFWTLSYSVCGRLSFMGHRSRDFWGQV